jgi:hypothetical protein
MSFFNGIQGNVAHDATDTGNPVKIGGKATDYERNTSGALGITEVAEDDRVDIAANLRGEQIEGVNGSYVLTTALDNQYDDNPTSATSAEVECWNYRWCTVGFDLVSTSTPTDILIEVETTQDGTNFHKMMDGFLGDWRYDDVACSTEIFESMTFPINAYKVRVRMKATGTEATKYFTVDNSFIALRN